MKHFLSMNHALPEARLVKRSKSVDHFFGVKNFSAALDALRRGPDGDEARVINRADGSGPGPATFLENHF